MPLLGSVYLSLSFKVTSPEPLTPVNVKSIVERKLRFAVTASAEPLTKPLFSVTLLTFSPDPSLIPTSQEGYKLVK